MLFLFPEVCRPEAVSYTHLDVYKRQVLDDQSNEEQFIDVYNTYKRLVYHTAYKIMGDSYLAEDVLQEVFLYVAKNFSKIHRENCHELACLLYTSRCV